MAMRRFFLSTEPVVGEEAHITGQDAKHITAVLRLRPGDDLILLTGGGKEYIAKIRSIESDTVRAAVLSEQAAEADPTIKVTVALGFLKEKKMEELIRPLTELGIHRLLPFFAERSVSRPDPHRIISRLDRWEKIARESLKQCRRAAAPEISPPVGFDQVLSLAKSSDIKLLFWEQEAGKPPVSLPAGSPSTVFILLGPEGGFTDREAAESRSAGFSICSLGPRILRAETAAVAACALVQYVYGDMGGQIGRRGGERKVVIEGAKS